MTWTDERVERLKEYWSQGLSASQIAARIGGITRNAVIGKAHRLKLASRPSPIRSGGGGSRPRARPKPTTTTAEGRNPPPLSGVTIAPLEAEVERVMRSMNKARPAARGGVGTTTCLWPFGNPGESDFHFCDQMALKDRSYCDEHCTMAYIRKDKTSAA